MKGKIITTIVMALVIAAAVLPVAGNMNIGKNIDLTNLEATIQGSIKNQYQHPQKICYFVTSKTTFIHIGSSITETTFHDCSGAGNHFTLFTIEYFALCRSNLLLIQPKDNSNPDVKNLYDIIIRDSLKPFYMQQKTKIMYDNIEYQMILNGEIEITNECLEVIGEVNGSCPMINISDEEIQESFLGFKNKILVTQYEENVIKLMYGFSLNLSTGLPITVEVEIFFTYDTSRKLPFDEYFFDEITSLSKNESASSITCQTSVTKKPRDRSITSPFLIFLDSHPNWFPFLQKFLNRIRQ